MKNLPGRLLRVACGTAVLLLGPASAQEAAPPAAPAPSEPQAPAAEQAPPETPDKAPDEGEGLSADNSLSFPVDI